MGWVLGVGLAKCFVLQGRAQICNPNVANVDGASLVDPEEAKIDALSLFAGLLQFVIG